MLLGNLYELYRSNADALCVFCHFYANFSGQMRSLRVFYNDESHSSGQLVIASRESQCKILHFHHGGLDKLEETFVDWKFLTSPHNEVAFTFERISLNLGKIIHTGKLMFVIRKE